MRLEMKSVGAKAAMIAVLVVLSVLPLLPAINAPFFYDDYNTIVMNPSIKSGDISGIFRNPETFSANKARMLRPLVTASLAWNWSEFGKSTAGWHITNLAAHILCVILVFLLIETLSGNTALAFLTTLFFGLHPSRVEPVIYLSARSEVLASLFYLAAFYLFCRAMKTEKKIAGILLGALSIIGFWLGLLSKDIVITLPAVLTLERLVFKKLDRKSIIWLALFWLSAGIYFLIRYSLAIDTFFPPARPRPVWENLLIEARAIVHYLRFLIWPVHPVVESHFSPINIAASVVSLVLIAAILGAGIYLTRKRPLSGFFIFFFFIVLSPSSSIIPLVVHGNIVRVYMAGIGFFVVLSELILAVINAEKGPRVSIPIAALIFICLFIQSANWAGKWPDPAGLWTATVASFPNHSRAHDNLGILLERRGDYYQAEMEYMSAINANPENASALDNYGRILFVKGDFKRAELYFKRSLLAEPFNCITYINYAQMLISDKNRLKEAGKIVDEIPPCPMYETEVLSLKNRIKDLSQP
jgi:tetratricopeptide (TPR) repeat protein